MPNHAVIAQLTRHPQISVARQQRQRTGLVTGHAALDRALPEGGWPRGALTELLVANPGSGELRLILPGLAKLTTEQRWVALVQPPWVPYPHAWAAAGIDLQRLLVVRPGDARSGWWALDQLLRSGAFGAVLGWPDSLPGPQLRKLQLAAETGQACGFLIRPIKAAGQHSTAALRIQLNRDQRQLRLRLLKCRGRLHGTELALALH